jgi:hypothetical protein
MSELMLMASLSLSASSSCKCRDHIISDKKNFGPMQTTVIWVCINSVFWQGGGKEGKKTGTEGKKTWTGGKETEPGQRK